ncbi:MAG: translation initiation factor IF-3 [Sphaerochaeta sp.]|nr:translation initiation factor IF-3 [Sphaerochaeta sp.]MCH3920021.1 translation initiation factor IF-3 [Sphaerochaeta sp.]MCI2045274.1 translation initiation factor IF-3 [Sphaerochaeta sp.]MCI2076971.1 translation initiation factor IF-3 [Sphaerochaeta sp.]MCI2097018.1 translation initiation factor IF-3 [Sphaerochaeta sp.]
MATKDLRINRQIRAKEVFVIDADGNQKGIMSVLDALRLAEDEGLDLVEVSPTANPPVCRILDFGKYRYEQEKRLRDAKKNQTTIKIKEIRMQPKIEKHDIETKGKFIADFLSQGNKVKISIRFRGREMAHTDLGKDTLNKILENLTTNGVEFNLDRPPLMEGKMMSIMVSPRNPNKGQQAAKPQQPQTDKQ